jgi:hypothetical protein
MNPTTTDQKLSPLCDTALMQQHPEFGDISGKLPPPKKTVKTVTYMIQFVYIDSCSLYKEPDAYG